MKVTKEFGYIPQQDTVNGGAFETQKHGYSKMLLSRTYFHQWHAHSPLWVYCLPTAIFILKRNITLWLSMTEYTYVSVSWHLCVCVCMFSSLFVCLCVCSCPVRSFVAGAINSPQSSAPVVHSFADILGLSLVYMPTLHVGEKYWHCQSTAHCFWT